MIDKPITAQELKDWQRKTDGASAGPWFVSESRGPHGGVGIWGPGEEYIAAPDAGMTDEDSEFTATAREAMPRILARVKELEEEVASYRGALWDFCDVSAAVGPVECESSVWHHVVRVLGGRRPGEKHGRE